MAVAVAAALALGGCQGCRVEATDAEREMLCLRFLQEEMMTEQQALLTDSNVRGIVRATLDEDALRDSGVLSESVGLLMEYAARKGDRELFDGQLALLQSHLLSRTGLVFWRLSADLTMTADANASVDDLRIAYALCLAHERWPDGGYLDPGKTLGRALRETVAPDGIMRDYLNWRGSGDPILAEKVSLTYLDLPAMRKLSLYDSGWSQVLRRSRAILQGGQTGAGLFYAKYDTESGAYVGGIGNMIHMSLAALALADDRPANRRFLSFLKKKMDEDGKIYAAYNAETGEPTAFFESTSVYAICARIALAQDDREFGMALFERMKWMQQLNPRSPLFGAFADDEVFAFDNLQALLTLRAFNHTESHGS